VPAQRRVRPIRSETGVVPTFFPYGEPPRGPERTGHLETIATRSRLYDSKIRAQRHRDTLFKVVTDPTRNPFADLSEACGRSAASS